MLSIWKPNIVVYKIIQNNVFEKKNWLPTKNRKIKLNRTSYILYFMHILMEMGNSNLKELGGRNGKILCTMEFLLFSLVYKNSKI